MSKIKVMVNGLPGNMARIVAGQVLASENLDLAHYSLTGPEITDLEAGVEDVSVKLILPDDREEAMSAIIEKEGPFISVDYSHPTAVNDNARFYCAKGLPFVMGTTGGDRELLAETVRASAISAVIAPNMAKQIVGFQAMMEYASETFPGLFDGYSLTIEESHQKGKADTSGTAKAMVGYFNALGAPFDGADIQKERDPNIQTEKWGVPEEYLGGHGWHTYTLRSKDDTVLFRFTHNVNGRDVYGQGTVDAVLFLDEKIKAGAKGRVFSMIDVLKKG